MKKALNAKVPEQLGCSLDSKKKIYEIFFSFGSTLRISNIKKYAYNAYYLKKNTVSNCGVWNELAAGTKYVINGARRSLLGISLTNNH